LLRRWTGHLSVALAPVLSLVLAAITSTVAKAAFGRVRPPIDVHEVHVASPAFPSGHATDAAGFFLAAAFVLSITVVHRRQARLACFGTALFCAALVGVSRLVLGVHWLSDVVAGWVLGTAIAVIVVVTSWWCTAMRSRRRERETPTPLGT
jgi:undecaprenyl-diphosphatase